LKRQLEVSIEAAHLVAGADGEKTRWMGVSTLRPADIMRSSSIFWMVALEAVTSASSAVFAALG
jgi:hypothetical protein